MKMNGMTLNEIIDTLAKGGEQKIGINNIMHKVLSELNDYSLSFVTCSLEDMGFNFVWNMFEDVYEITKK